MIVLLLEAVNPVYRRNRLANVLKTARKHKQLADKWQEVSDKLDKKIVPRKDMSKHNNRRSNAQDSHLHHIDQRVKAHKIADGRYPMPDGTNKIRGVPANPLRKNRDETRGKHKRSPEVVKDIRNHDIQARKGWNKAAKTESWGGPRRLGPGMSGKEPVGPLPDFGAKDYASSSKKNAKEAGGKKSALGKAWRKAAAASLNRYRKSLAKVKEAGSSKTESERAKRLFKKYRSHMDNKNVPWGDSGPKGKKWQGRAERLKGALKKLGGPGGSGGSDGARKDLEHMFFNKAGGVRKKIASAKKRDLTTRHTDKLRSRHTAEMSLTKSPVFKKASKLP